MRKQLDTNILGIDLQLSERSFQEVSDLTSFTLSRATTGKGGEVLLSPIDGAKSSILMIRQSISYWINNKNFIVRWFFNYKLSVIKLSKGLSPRQITALANKVSELDGNDIKKKVVAEHQ